MKPVGTVHLATARSTAGVRRRHELYEFDTRWDVQMAAVATALLMLREAI